MRCCLSGRDDPRVTEGAVFLRDGVAPGASARTGHRSKPIEPVRHGVPEAVGRSGAGRVERSFRILLVEDEPDICEIAATVLQDGGYQVTVASDGLAGLEIARRDMPGLIITDYQMPRLTGLEMIECLRAGGYGHPIILTTASLEEQLPRRPGYDAFLAKPYRFRALVELVERLRQRQLAQC